MDNIVYSLARFQWTVISAILRLMYGFRIEGAENIPRKGPYIYLVKEAGGLIAMLCVAVSLVSLLYHEMRALGDKFVFLIHEDAWNMLFRRYPMPVTGRPVRPHSAGALARHLIDLLKALQDGGKVVINPEGDAAWDGRPLPIRPGAAWLGLHSAIPLVPMSPSAGCYDIWPIWQNRPNLRGDVVLRIGKPFRLTDSPIEHVTQSDLDKACARIEAEINKLYYGSGGISEWASPPLRHGVPLELPFRVPSVPTQSTLSMRHQVVESSGAHQQDSQSKVKGTKWGIPQLLWRCPVCYTNDALIHESAWFSPQALHCKECGARWNIHREAGKDFRLKVIGGPADWLGVDMALSTWRERMKEGFQPVPIEARDVNLLEHEELYLRGHPVELLPYQPSVLFQNWTSGEAPRVQSFNQAVSPEWASIGKGRLFLTSQRLLWEGSRGSVEFGWPHVRSVFLAWRNVLGIGYGSAYYRFNFGSEVVQKWLTYAGTMARKANPHEPNKVVSITPF